jgi:hypothetical protein
MNFVNLYKIRLDIFFSAGSARAGMPVVQNVRTPMQDEKHGDN